MTTEQVAAEVAQRLNVPGAYVRVSAEVIHSPGSREFDLPPKFFTNWRVTIDGQDLPERLEADSNA